MAKVVDLPYRSFSRYLKEQFGGSVYKITIDAGFTCPNRDGTVATGGCTYCDAEGSGPGTDRQVLSVTEQIQSAQERRSGTGMYLAYFQAFTNTNAPVECLRELYEEALAQRGVVGLDIATRPDCVGDDVLDLLAELHERTHLWLELGLQSASDETLKRVNRGHTVAQFVDAVQRAHERKLNVCAHVIFGLPGETRDMMRDTARLVADLSVEGVKFHSLYLVPGTDMEKTVHENGSSLLSREQYAAAVADALELIPPNTVIQRLTGDPPPGIVPDPPWTGNKHATIEAVAAELKRRGHRQGSKYRKK